jgi:hypothetical protein
MTYNEKITIQHARKMCQGRKILICDNVQKTLTKKGLKRVSKVLEKRYGILTFTDYSATCEIFTKKSNPNLETNIHQIDGKGSWRVGSIRNDDETIILPITPLN